mmetsp:Transcript_23047/g.72543  ORF Transcript_23047/g.72543 Transcript_23047/m.72543 type:complete len:434 (-) Transcript_23047:262-1563(-)
MGACFAFCVPGAKAAQCAGNSTDVQQQVLEAVERCQDEQLLQDMLQMMTVSDPQTLVEKHSPVSARSLLKKCSVIQALSSVRTIPGRIGLDIGGTLAKMVFMQLASEQNTMAECFGTTGRRHPELSFELYLHSHVYHMHFVSGSTANLEKVLQSAKTFPAPHAARQQVVASGGGAHRFASTMLEALNIEMLPFQEMESLVYGLHFLEEHGPAGEVFTLGELGEELPAAWPSPFFPSLLVNMGSGVSILRLDECHDGPMGKSFTRLGGTACGGATFLGLARLMTAATSFEQALGLAQRGDPTRVNKLVGDIYGVEGCSHLGLPGTLTAAYFGKLMSMTGDVRAAIDEADAAAALLMMVVQESVVLARAFSLLVNSQIGRLPPVFFVGGFLAENTMARGLIANTFRNLELPPALFLRHADFLGALGSIMKSVESH